MSLIDDAYALIAIPSYAIGTVLPGVVVRDLGRDELGITQHPVEVGATVSDHAFKLPVRLEMLCGWSDSTAASEGYVEAVYQEILALQALREPFTVFTAKRAYPNMLIQSIAKADEKETAGALMLQVSLQEVIITSTGGGGFAGGGVAPNGAQANPGRTGATVQGGTRQVIDAGTVVNPNVA